MGPKTLRLFDSARHGLLLSRTRGRALHLRRCEFVRRLSFRDLAVHMEKLAVPPSEKVNSHSKVPPMEAPMSRPVEKSAPVSERQIPEGYPTHEEIELRAHQIYVERGSADGQDVEDWLQAERELLGKHRNPGRMAKAAAV